jgi:hypothetical protein
MDFHACISDAIERFLWFGKLNIARGFGVWNLEKTPWQKDTVRGDSAPHRLIPTHFAGWREIRPSLACESKIPMLTPSLPH